MFRFNEKLKVKSIIKKPLQNYQSNPVLVRILWSFLFFAIQSQDAYIYSVTAHFPISSFVKAGFHKRISTRIKAYESAVSMKFSVGRLLLMIAFISSSVSHDTNVT